VNGRQPDKHEASVEDASLILGDHDHNTGKVRGAVCHHYDNEVGAWGA